MMQARPPTAILVALGLSASGHLLMLPGLTLTPLQPGPPASHTASAQNDTLPTVVRWVQATPAIGQPTPPTSKPTPSTHATQAPVSTPTSALPPSDAPPQTDAHSVADALPSDTPGSATVYWPARDVDRLALPIAPPDLAWLSGQAWQGGPIRVRLAISAQGQVSQVQVLLAPVGAQGVLDALQTALLATPFMPARKTGQDVASVQDIELEPAIP